MSAPIKHRLCECFAHILYGAGAHKSVVLRVLQVQPTRTHDTLIMRVFHTYFYILHGVSARKWVIMQVLHV